MELISKVQQDRLNRSFLNEEKRLIGDGGYLAPSAELWNDLLVTASLKKNILLIGPSGSGKTKLADSISAFFQQPIQVVNCSVDLDSEALLGFKTIVKADDQLIIDFIEGPVVKAMKNGHILYIDEINMAKPDTLSILNSVLDYRRMLVNPFTGKTIIAHSDFLVIAAINEGYIGTTPMNEALANRFISFSIPYIQSDMLRELLIGKFPHVSTRLVDSFISFSQDLMKQVQNGLLSDEASSIRSLEDAIELAQFMDPIRAITYAIAEKLRDEMERDLVIQLAKTWM
ncbi:ATP-binding protein [Paenisporosarcina cavernae]